jgi:L,D-transpeptidase YcbB
MKLHAIRLAAAVFLLASAPAACGPSEALPSDGGPDLPTPEAPRTQRLDHARGPGEEPASASELARLVEARRRYLRIVEDGGWEPVPPGPTLDPGSLDQRVEGLRARLTASGHLPDRERVPSPPEVYDARLEAAVREFQRTHGLAEDGRVGPATLTALNVPAERRLAQLELSLERLRARPPDLGDRYVLVNVPAFIARVVDHGTETLRLRVIVGQPSRPTPTFSARMTHLVLAPYWHVPPGIALREKLPRFREAPQDLAREGMALLDRATERPVDPGTVDWNRITAPEFGSRYRLRQDPGPGNAMGHVKFMFPNAHHVYLHDTPSRELFEVPVRAFSSGCVRVDGALHLAAHLLRENPFWTPERIRETVAEGRERHVDLPNPYEVHIEYRTVFVDSGGALNFREDIYGRDDEELARPDGAPEGRENDVIPVPAPRTDSGTNLGPRVTPGFRACVGEAGAD